MDAGRFDESAPSSNLVAPLRTMTSSAALRAATKPKSCRCRVGAGLAHVVDVEVDDADIDIDDADDDVEMEAEERSFLRPSPAGPPFIKRADDPTQRLKKGRLSRRRNAAPGAKLRQSIALLEAAQNEAPGSREVHDKLCDVLMEAGNQRAPFISAVVSASRLVRGRLGYGRANLDEILLIGRSAPKPLSMLQALGYAVPGQAYASRQSLRRRECTRTPLPSYDLEEVSADDALHRIPSSPNFLSISPSQRSRTRSTIRSRTKRLCRASRSKTKRRRTSWRAH